MSGPSQPVIKGYVDDIRAAAVREGRDPADILIFVMFTAITATTQAAAEEKYAEYRQYVSTDGALSLMSGSGAPAIIATALAVRLMPSSILSRVSLS